MATREQLVDALRRADAAGDVEAARAIARRLSETQPVQQVAPPQEERGALRKAFDFVTENVADPISGLIESGTQLASSTLAEPIAGLAGIASTPFTEDTRGVVQKTREALTYRPQSRSGQALSAAAGKVVAPVGEAIKGAEEFLGEQAMERTGSPALAAAATTLPTAILEAIGLKGGIKARAKAADIKQAATKRAAGNLLSEATPTADVLKETSRKVYKEIDDLGVTVKPDALKSLTKGIDELLKKEAAIKESTPKAFGALQAFKRRAAGDAPIPLSELDKLRQTIREAPAVTELGEQRLAGMIVDEIDDFMDRSGSTAFNAPEGAKVGARYKVARDLYGRAKKSELVSEAMDRASRRSSGFNTAIKNEFNSILNNKKRAKYFNKQELAAIRSVVEQPAKQNLAEFIGKFGFETVGPSSHFIGGTSAGTLGGVVGGMLGGPVGATVGAVGVPAVGTAFRRMASKMRQNRAALADQVIRAGYDANKIAEAYMRTVPKAARSADDLATLLMDPNVALTKLRMDVPLLSEAAKLAEQNRSALAGAAAASTVKEEEK